MKTPQTYTIDFSGPVIEEAEAFQVSMMQGFSYDAEHKAWRVEAQRGFIQYRLVLNRPADIMGSATLAIPQSTGHASSSIIINGRIFVPVFEVTKPDFETLKWPVPADFFWAGDNTIITPLLPGSTAPVLVRAVSVSF